SLDQLLRIYVGDEPHRAILSGAVRRGEVARIRSAILVADMRNFTRITSALTPEASVDLLNGYFDCLVPPIEAEGGEVLKYLGEPLLMSQSFVDFLWGDPEFVGEHNVNGFDEPIAVFRPR